MVLILLFRFLMGYVRVKFSGDFCERMLNLCGRNGATLWDIKKSENGNIEANISVKNFKKMREIRAKSGISVKILKRFGLPFITKKYSKRIGFAFGVATFFFLLVFLSGFIWKIEVVGNERVNDTLIIEACEELDIREGTRIKSIDTDKAKEQLLIKLNGLAWASFNIEGSRLTVNVSEIKNSAQNAAAPSNLLAKADGVIKRVDVKSGDCKIKVGDAVVKDDLLVSGEIVFSESGVIKQVQSKGEIIAETKRIFTVTIPKTQIKSIISDKAVCKSVLSFFSVKIPLYLGEVKGPYRFKTENIKMALFGEGLPISITKKTFFKTKEIEIKISEEEAKALGKETIKNSLNGGGYVSSKLIDEKMSENDDGFILTQTYKCEENIAYEVKIEENILQ